MNLRTDLALEAVGFAEELSEEDCQKTTTTRSGITITTLHIRTRRAAECLEKPVGTYTTLELPPLTDDEKFLNEGAAVIAEILCGLLPKEGTVLTVGLGNRAITPDALGPKTADMVLATRHIQGEFARSVGLDDLRPSAVVIPGVLGQTGTESSEAVGGICGVVHPAAVVVVDALAAGSVHRLGRTVQVSDTGISPGAGVGNHRLPLNSETFGVPVIGIGVPTVVDAAVIAAAGGDTPLSNDLRQLLVTPKEIDLLIHRAAKLIAAGINLALQPHYAPLELISLALS